MRPTRPGETERLLCTLCTFCAFRFNARLGRLYKKQALCRLFVSHPSKILNILPVKEYLEEDVV